MVRYFHYQLLGQISGEASNINCFNAGFIRRRIFVSVKMALTIRGINETTVEPCGKKKFRRHVLLSGRLSGYLLRKINFPLALPDKSVSVSFTILTTPPL